MGTAPQQVIGKLGNPKGAIMSYPADIYNTPYACVLRFSEYNREISYESGKQTPLAAIILPLPAQLAESQSISHSDFESPYIAGFIQAATALSQGNSLIDNVIKLTEENLGILANKGIEEIGKKIASKVGNEFISEASADLAVAGQRGAFTGQITNPHLTVLFTGVELRGFQYSWTFSPRSSQESRELNEIFNYIRKASLPSYIYGKIGLNYPKEVQVDFIGNGIEKFVFGTKRTVITDVQINYAADGHPSFYKDGAPTSVYLQITLKEVAIRTADDYEDSYLQNRNAAREN
jgi:hypothetical protein